MMAAGLELMLVGMGTVFFFLTTLIGATHLMSHLVTRFAPEPSLASNQAGAPHQAVEEAEEVAAIVAAIEMHRRTQS